MIFGAKKHKAVADAVTEAVRPSVAAASTRNGVPAGFWDDPFVLGYLMGRINAGMAIEGGESLSVADKGRVVVDCLAALSGAKGKAISEMAMVHAQTEQPDFMRANASGMFIALYEAERVPDEDRNPAVAAASQAVGASGAQPCRRSIADHLAQNYWVNEVRNRFTVGI